MTDAPAVSRTRDELWYAYEVQKQAIRTSSLAFDGGARGEAVRLANTLFILAGPRMRSHTPILEQLGVLGRLRVQTTIGAGNESGTPLLAALLIWGGGVNLVRLVPLGLGGLMTGRALAVEEWWDEIVLSNESGTTLTRLQIVRSMRDQDGGVHFDSALKNPAYHAASRGELSGFYVRQPTGDKIAVPDALEVTVRQMAEEFGLALNGVMRGLEPSGASLLYRQKNGPVILTVGEPAPLSSEDAILPGSAAEAL